MRANLIRAGIILSLVLALGWAVIRSESKYDAAIHAPDGERLAAVGVYLFPLRVETSSLAYDEGANVFYTTADKGQPHIIMFRPGKVELDILLADTVRGLKRNSDFEGVEIIDRPGQPKYLQISTERFLRRDSLVQPAVSLPGLRYLPELSFAVKPDELGNNTNFEAITYDPFADIIFLGKERGPHEIYVRQGNLPAERLMTQAEFDSAYFRYLDAVLAPVVASDRLAMLRQVAFSGMAFDKETRRLLVLNRFGRSVVELEVHLGSGTGWHITRVMPYERVDDMTVEGLAPLAQVYGLAEGLAVWGQGSEKRLGLITDPGAAGQPTFYIFPFPR